jgi:hypothetical protein
MRISRTLQIKAAMQKHGMEVSHVRPLDKNTELEVIDTIVN